MTDVVQSVLYYTQEEMDSALKLLRENVKRQQSQVHQGVTLNAFRELLKEMDITNETATAIYNAVAEANEWDTITSLKMKYEVAVYHEGDEIARFSDIEADDEDDACSQVEDGIEIDEATVSITVSYGNRTYTGEGNLNTWGIELTYEAEEQ